MLKGIKKFLPFTPQGFCFLILGLLILLKGIFQADLAALFWGATFLAILIYAYTCSHVYRAVFKKHLQRQGDQLRLFLPAGGVFPGTEFNYKLTLKIPGLIIPGFTCSLNLAFTSPDEKVLELQHLLHSGENTIQASRVAAARGLYTLSHVTFHFRDILGFTQGRLEHTIEECLRVYPGFRPAARLKYQTTGIETTDRLKSCKTSDELLEVRKYYSGDDTRKINWKMLAHIGELYIRKGEDTPPPDSRLLFVLDVTLSTLVPPQIRTEYLDNLVEHCCSLMLSQLAGEASVLLLLPGREALPFTKDNKQELLELMAEIRWLRETPVWKLPSRQNLNGIICSSPGSPALPQLIREFKSRKWKINLFLKDHLFPATRPLHWNLHNLLFLPEKKQQRINFAGIEKAFKTALLSQLDTYKLKPWKVDTIGII